MNQQSEKESSKFIIYTFFVFLSLFWGLSFLWTKIALEELKPTELLAIRWTMAMVLFAVLIGLKIIKVEYKGKPKKPLLISVMIQPCLYAIFETWGIDLTTSSVSSIFIAVIPLAVVVINLVVFKQKVSHRTGLAIIVGLTGVIVSVVFAPDFAVGGKFLGYLSLIATVLAGATYNILSNRIGQHYSAMEYTFAMAVAASIFFNTISLLQGNGLNGYAIAFSGGRTTMSMILLGVGCSFAAYIMYNYTLSKLKAELASCIQANAITVIGVIAGIVLGGDTWGWYTIVGLIMTISGIVISSRDVK